jgi:hypothetical protein
MNGLEKENVSTPVTHLICIIHILYLLYFLENLLNRINTGYRYNTVNKKQYPVDMRRFAVSLYYYSPRAYRYIRERFKNALPAESSLRRWNSKLDATPGLTAPCFDFLKQKQKDGMTYCCLMVGILILMTVTTFWRGFESRHCNFIYFNFFYIMYLTQL